MNYSNLVKVDLEMLGTLVDINPEYQKFIDKIKQYKIECKKDYEEYLKLKEEFIDIQREYREKRLEAINQGRFGSR